MSLPEAVLERASTIVISQQASTAGVSPGATGADNVVASLQLPGSTFKTNGTGIRIEASGSFAANGNTKTLKLIFNPASATVGSTVGASGTTLAATAAITTNGGGWKLSADIFRTASNVQVSSSGVAIYGPASVAAGAVAVTAPALPAATDTSAIFIAVTANCATATTDVVFNVLTVTGLN